MNSSAPASDPVDTAPTARKSARAAFLAWAQTHPVLAAALYTATVTLVSGCLQFGGAIINASATRHGPSSTANATVKGAKLAAQAAERDTDLEVLTSQSSICPTHMSAPACRAAAIQLRHLGP
jgi:hypothetical protein